MPPKFKMRFVKLANNSMLHKNFMKNVSNNLRKSKIFILKYWQQSASMWKYCGTQILIGPLLSSKNSQFHSEAKFLNLSCENELIYLHENKISLPCKWLCNNISLALKRRLGVTQKWPAILIHYLHCPWTTHASC